MGEERVQIPSGLLFKISLASSNVEQGPVKSLVPGSSPGLGSHTLQAKVAKQSPKL